MKQAYDMMRNQEIDMAILDVPPTSVELGTRNGLQALHNLVEGVSRAQHRDLLASEILGLDERCLGQLALQPEMQLVNPSITDTPSI